MAAQFPTLSLEYLQSRLSYNPASGEFRWLPLSELTTGGPAWNARFAGKRAGYNSKGYTHIGIFRRKFAAHRLAWLFVYGFWPTELIDHINGKTDDNRISNLRQATHRQNQQNRAPSKCNKCGLTGVIMHKNGKFLARISKNRRQYHLGTFLTAESAYAAYLAAKSRLHTFQPTLRPA